MALSIQFTAVDGVETIALTNLLKVVTPRPSPTFGDAGDQIWKYDPAKGWIKYWWRTANKNWVKKDTTITTEDTVKSGDTIFFRRGNGAATTTITLSGAVRPFEGETVYNNISAGTSRFIGYPWPIAFDAITLPLHQSVGAKGSPTFGDAGDQIWTYDADLGWVKYWYRSVGRAYRMKGASADATTIPIPAGQGFFFRRSNAGEAETITFTYPAKTVAK